MHTNTQKYFWISCGGTGGHLTPAIALGQELSLLGYKNYCWIYKGKVIGENFKEEMTEGHLQILGHDMSKWQKCLHFLKDFRKLTTLFKTHPPLGVISTGGGSQLVVLLFSWIRKIPIFLCEQNCILGRANRLFSKMAHTIYISFPLKGVKAQMKFRLTGNPIRKSFFNAQDPGNLKQKYQLCPDRMTLLAIGGSQGARAINEWILRSENELVRPDFKIQWIHITGPAQYEQCLEFHQRMKWPHVCVPFHQKPEELYAMSDIAVARSGAGVLAELALFGIPSILIPYPHAMDDHQYWNARYMAENGAAILLREEDFNQKGFQKIKKMIRDDSLRTKMSQSSKKLSKPDAGQKIIRDFLSKVQI